MAKSSRRKKSNKSRRPARTRSAASGGEPSPSKPEHNPIVVRSRAQFDRLVAGELPLLIDFWAPWCGPCKMMAPIFESVGAEFEDRVRFVKIDTQQLPELGAAFGVRSIPTLLALHGSEVTDTHVGLMPEPGLIRMARRADDRAQGVTLRHRLARLFGRDGREPATTAVADVGA